MHRLYFHAMIFTNGEHKMFRKIILLFIFVLGLGAAGSAQTAEVEILTRPGARYTDQARMNNVQGRVYLKITFLAGGEIGDVVYIKETSLKKDKLLKQKKLTQYGLVDQAIAAAKLIKFKPALRNGKPITVTKTVVYSFDIY